MRRFIWLCAAITTIALLIPGTSQASTTPSAVQRKVAGQLTLDCADMNTKALSYAVAHHYCTSSGKNVLSPDGEVTGNCGSSFMTVSDGGRGTAELDWGFESTAGIVIQHTLSVSWNNLSMVGLHGSFRDDGVMFAADYENLKDVFSGHGFVHAKLSGFVLLIWGGVCQILNPQDVEIVH